MTLPASGYIRSFLRDYTVQVNVGVCDYEKKGPQAVIINIEMEAADVPRYDDPAEESLDRVMDYTQVHRFIATEVVPMGHIPLLEPIAEMIVAFCFRDPRVAKVRVRLEKPAVLPDVTVGIELFRARNAA